jgi:hypothetical protein
MEDAADEEEAQYIEEKRRNKNRREALISVFCFLESTKDQ